MQYEISVESDTPATKSDVRTKAYVATSGLTGLQTALSCLNPIYMLTSLIPLQTTLVLTASNYMAGGRPVGCFHH